jgi:type VI secretion system protein ImpL
VQTRNWQPQVKDDHSLSLSNEALVQFRHAAWIRSVFFQDGSKLPSLHFSMKPLSLSADASQFRLEVDGQSINYRHGPAISRRLNWPGSQGPDQARIVFDRINGGSFSTTKDGPWAWFQLLDESRVRPTRSGDRLRVTFRVSNLSATYELQADSVVNPFRSRDQARFSCPGRL